MPVDFHYEWRPPMSKWWGESVDLRGSFYRGRGQDIDAPHDTEVKP
jgi:hypothetical protein